jgi:hypothetical protein
MRSFGWIGRPQNRALDRDTGGDAERLEPEGAHASERVAGRGCRQSHETLEPVRSQRWAGVVGLRAGREDRRDEDQVRATDPAKLVRGVDGRADPPILRKVRPDLLRPRSIDGEVQMSAHEERDIQPAVDGELGAARTRDLRQPARPIDEGPDRRSGIAVLDADLGPEAGHCIERSPVRRLGERPVGENDELR